MIRKLVIFLGFFATVSLANLKSEDTLRCWVVLPDSALRQVDIEALLNKSRELQEQARVMTETANEMQEKAKYLQEKMKDYDEKLREIMKERLEHFKEIEKLKKYVPPEVEVIRSERFDETGLIRDGVKYFIRIWKHPPKELFNMPTFKLR